MAMRQTRVENGMLEGIPAGNRSYTVFRSVPYAAAPVGDLRWRAPAAHDDWDGVYQAKEFRPIAAQAAEAHPFYSEEFYRCREDMSEDCLYLSVWTPVETPKEMLPVLVFIHGGAFRSGYHYEIILNGLRLYAEEMMDCGDLEQWIAECDALSSRLQRDWRMEASSPQPLQAGMEMSKSDFWELIAGAKKECGQNMGSSINWLTSQLIAHGPQQTQDFTYIMDGYMSLSYQYGLWTAASLMCENGCSDDSFIDFRALLIAQDEEIYLAALADPDSLADVEAYGGCQFEELPYTGNETMKYLTGKDIYENTDPDAYKALVAELKKDITYGEGVDYPYEWDEIEAHFSRLMAQSSSRWAAPPPTTSKMASLIQRLPTLSGNTGSSAGRGRCSG